MATASINGKHFDTLILGAGMSGIACASRLHEHTHYRKGKKTLKVLEGRERIGGRIESVHVHGCRLDTGANWIHGIGTKEKPNPLMGVLPHKQYRPVSGSVVFQAPPGTEDATEITGMSERDHDDWVALKPVPSMQQPVCQGQEKVDSVIPTDIAGTMMGSLWAMVGSLHETATQTLHNKAKHTTMLQAITQARELRDAYRAVPAKYHRSLSAMPQFLEGMEAAPLAAQSAEKSSDQPGMGLLEFALDDFEGDQVFLQDGYTAVIEELAKDLMEDGLIELGVEVTQVDWSKNPIQVETSRGSYTAGEVVCTLPLGVLQHRSLGLSSGAVSASLFEPSLPWEKQTAISSLGFGTLDKIMMVYQHPWWTEEPYTSIFKKGLVRQPVAKGTEDEVDGEKGEDFAAPNSFLGFTAELPGIEIHKDGTISPGLRLLSVFNLHGLTGFPVLSTFVSCANAAQIEAMTSEQAGGIVHRALTSWLGREPPKPVGIHVTRWANEHFSRGSYSHMIAGLSEEQHRVEFQRPVVNKGGGALRFAGEHTSRNHFATVHGALLSGWREANAILEGKQD
ncbi:unnamed protein product [Discula destructiva]